MMLSLRGHVHSIPTVGTAVRAEWAPTGADMEFFCGNQENGRSYCTRLLQIHGAVYEIHNFWGKGQAELDESPPPHPFFSPVENGFVQKALKNCRLHSGLAQRELFSDVNEELAINWAPAGGSANQKKGGGVEVVAEWEFNTKPQAALNYECLAWAIKMKIYVYRETGSLNLQRPRCRLDFECFFTFGLDNKGLHSTEKAFCKDLYSKGNKNIKKSVPTKGFFFFLTTLTQLQKTFTVA